MNKTQNFVDQAEPELNPMVMYASTDEKNYKAEMEIFDRWQSFSSQMLQLALLGMAIFGFLFQHIFSEFKINKLPDCPIGSAKLLSKLSVILFGSSALFALVYRYGSIEGMMHFFRGLKNPSQRSVELQKRYMWLSRCLIFKVLSAICLGLGAVLSAVSIFKLLSETCH